MINRHIFRQLFAYKLPTIMCAKQLTDDEKSQEEQLVQSQKAIEDLRQLGESYERGQRINATVNLLV